MRAILEDTFSGVNLHIIGRLSKAGTDMKCARDIG